MRSLGRRQMGLWVGMLVVAGSLGWNAVRAAVARTAHASCAAGSGASAHSSALPRLRPLVDGRGWLTGYPTDDGRPRPERRLTTLAFLDGPFGDRWVYGDAEASQSRVRTWDAGHGCLEAEVLIDGLVFSATVDPTGARLVHDLVDATTREELGIWERPLSDPDAGNLVMRGIDGDDGSAASGPTSLTGRSTGSLVVRSCGDAGCITRRLGRSGGVDVRSRVVGPTGNDVPRVDPRPVPETGPATWEQDERLTFRWGPGQTPGWVRQAVTAAAIDVEASRRSRAATFAYSESGDDMVRLAAQMSGPCIAALACANGVIPSWWKVLIRPHGAEVDWGTVRWCQAYDDPPAGCYDLEHAMVHEFGHIEGLAHPEDFGWRLGVLETVMATAPPQRPQTGWNLHRFGPCDAARLQRRYDIADGTRLADCGRLGSRLTIEASASAVGAFQPVTITAALRVKDRDAYDRLGGNRLSGRSVAIERRPVGSTSWTPLETTPGMHRRDVDVNVRPGSLPTTGRSSRDPTTRGSRQPISPIVTVRVATCGPGVCPDGTTVGRSVRQ